MSYQSQYFGKIPETVFNRIFYSVMKTRLFIASIFLLGLCTTEVVIGQQAKTMRGPVIMDYGLIFPIENADLHLNSEKEYKVLFDVFTDDSKKSKINPLINTVARFINMHVYHGVPVENLDIALVLHGSATKAAMSEEAFKAKFGYDNPDIPLIDALVNARVNVYVCGQSFFAHGYTTEQKSEHVKLGLSALTVLTEYQSDGFQLINFN